MADRFLDNDIVSQIKEAFAEMKKPVEMLLFSRKEDCVTCSDMRQLAQEVADISDKLSLSFYDVEDDAALAAKFGVDKVPVLVLAAKDGEEITDYGVRYVGLPAGHEFGSFISDLMMVSQRDSGLSPQSRQFLGTLKTPLKFMVFFTPTCPHCPRAVSLAHKFALESSLVQAEAISAMEFFDLSNEYEVSGVPHTAVLDESGKLLATIVGGVPEQYMVDELKAKIN